MLARFRSHAAIAASTLGLLVLLTITERRLAEITFNRFTATTSFQNHDALDGDEVRVRLILRVDANPPALSVTVAQIPDRLVAAVPNAAPMRVVLDRHSPRGPPMRLALAAADHSDLTDS
jgi:hypothetical protein